MTKPKTSADLGSIRSSALVRPFVALAVPLAAVAVAFTIGAIMLLALGANPIDGYAALLDGAFGGWNELADTAIKSAPLLLVGVGICIAFRAGVINIGGEGQIIIGAIFSTVVALALPDLPRMFLVPLVLIGGGLPLSHCEQTKRGCYSGTNGYDRNIVNATSATHGPSWRMIVEMSSPPKALGIYPGGQSGNPGSLYYDNFIDDWAVGKYHELHFMQDKTVTKKIIATQTLTPTN